VTSTCARVRLRWLVDCVPDGAPQNTSPSHTSPRGRRFVRPARFDHRDVDWTADAWSIVVAALVVEVDGPPDREGRQEAIARFLLDDTPQHWLARGRRFTLFEDRAIAEAEVTDMVPAPKATG
jgi:hypothetical protein